MANTKVEFKVSVAGKCKEVYLVGSVAALGEWDPKKAVKLELCDTCNKYTAAKLLPAGETVEFKVLSAKTWDAVEKGLYGEEVENHVIVPEKGLTVEVEVVNFAK